jgi:hypothetical protein
MMSAARLLDIRMAAFWMSSALLTVVALWFGISILGSGGADWRGKFELGFLAFCVAGAPAILAILAAAFALIAKRRPTGLIQAMTHGCAALYGFAFYALHTVGTL